MKKFLSRRSILVIFSILFSIFIFKISDVSSFNPALNGTATQINWACTNLCNLLGSNIAAGGPMNIDKSWDNVTVAYNLWWQIFGKEPFHGLIVARYGPANPHQNANGNWVYYTPLGGDDTAPHGVLIVNLDGTWSAALYDEGTGYVTERGWWDYVPPPPPQCPTLSFSKNPALPNENVTLSWGNATNATQCSLNHSIGPVACTDGSTTVSSPSTDTYTFTASNPGNPPINCPVVLNINSNPPASTYYKCSGVSCVVDNSGGTNFPNDLTCGETCQCVNFQISPSTLNMSLYGSANLTASGYSGSVSWQSSNTSIATVGSSGTQVGVYGAGSGSTIITATDSYGCRKQVIVNVSSPSWYLDVKPSDASIMVGETLYYEAIAWDNNNPGHGIVVTGRVSWSLSRTDIANIIHDYHSSSEPCDYYGCYGINGLAAGDGIIYANSSTYGGASQTFHVRDFSVDANPSTITAPSTGASQLTTVSVQSINGFNNRVDFSLSGLPPGATQTFSPRNYISISPGSVTLTINTASVAAGTYPLKVTGTYIKRDYDGNILGTFTRSKNITLAIGNLTASLTPDPDHGDAPLNGVNLTATAGGTAQGNLNYTFYCNRSDAGTNITSGYIAKYDNRSETTFPSGSVCNYSSPGTYTAKVIIERGGFAAEARKTVTVNGPPVAVATISKDGCPCQDAITVIPGVPATIALCADGSSDPDGWTDPTNGISNGGKCEWNSDLNQGTPTFERTISNPASPSACNISLGNLTFNDAPNTYTYQVLRITDKPGAVSNIGTVSVTIQASSNNPPSANNLQATQPDYCTITWPSAIFVWNFTDPDADSQSAYQIQVDNNSGFTSPVIDTGKVISSSNSYASLSGTLSFNTAYYWRLKVWDSKDLASSWISGSSFTTPRHQYPTIDFSWSPQNPPANEDVQFADQSTVYGGATKSSWSWTFQDGNPANSSVQNPTVKFLSSGQKAVTLLVTDSDGFSCQAQKTINAQMPLPKWTEIPPF